MDKPGIRELLIDCVLDAQLLERVRHSPESVFADYELDEATRALLASPDERLLDLLGQAVRDETAGDESADAGHASTGAAIERVADPTDPDVATQLEVASISYSLPESRLAVRLVPFLQHSMEDDSGETGSPSLAIKYAGHLDNLTEGMEIEDLPEVPAAGVPGRQLPTLAVSVAIQPQATTDAAGNLQITFSLSATLPQATDEHGSLPAGGATGADDPRAWHHDTTSPGVLEAAGHVRDAAEADRRARLLDLIETMTAPNSQREASQ